MINRLWRIINKFVNKETISYLFFGVLTTLVDLSVFFISNNIFNIKYIIATVFAWTASVLFAYITNKLWVFNSKSMEFIIILKEASIFFIARLFSLGFTVIWMLFTVEILSMDQFISKLLACILIVIINYFLSKFLIFKKYKDII